MKEGEKVARYRQFKGIKQELLAHDLGISQSELSKIENLDVIEKEIFSQIADALDVSEEFLKKFDENFALYHISNKVENTTISENSNGISQIFNPLDKVVELYERLLQSEREKIEILKNK